MSTTTASAYLFTYSPQDTTKNPTYAYMNHINTYFHSWHKCMSDFEVNPEFNQNGNLHYHGYFVIKDPYKWFKFILPKMKYNGLVKINKVEDNLDKAMEYCRKDRELMSKIIEHKIPYNQEDKIKHIYPDHEPQTVIEYIKHHNFIDGSTDIYEHKYIEQTTSKDPYKWDTSLDD